MVLDVAIWTGKELSAEQARELDDTFLSSDPFEYFRSRVASLLAWDEAAALDHVEHAEAPEGGIRAEFNQYMQRPAVAGPFRELDVQAQVAADALAVRHHAAEALLRLPLARLTPQALPGEQCVWAEMASGPTQIADVIARWDEGAQSPEAGERLLRSVVSPDSVETGRTKAEIVDAVNVFGEWLAYAATLFRPSEIDLHTAHNKVKHGLAVRARADMRVTFVTTPPHADGSVSRERLHR